MDVAGLRKLLESVRVYAVGPHYAPEAREDGWQWSVALVTTEPNSIAGMQIMLTRGFAALLAVAEAAEEVNRENAKWGDVNLGTMCALAAALAALQEAP